jgi:hypothetical protein
MFRIGTAPKLTNLGSINDAIVDDTRHAVLQVVKSRGTLPNALAMLLTVGDLQIPLDIQWKSGSGEAGPFVVNIDSFGYSPDVEWALDLGHVRFNSPEQEHAMLLLAVEALLVFGLWFDGIPRPDGEVVVNYLGKLWRLSDFGYLTDEENTRA